MEMRCREVNPALCRRQRGGQWCSGTICPLGPRCAGSMCALLIDSVQSTLKDSLCFFPSTACDTKLRTAPIRQGPRFCAFSLCVCSPLLCHSSCVCLKGSREKAVPVNSGLAARPTALPTLHGVPVSSDLWVVLSAVKYLGLN